MIFTSRTRPPNVSREKSMIKRSWAAIKSKLKSARRVKQPVQVIPFSQKQVGIDPSSQEEAPSINQPASEDKHTRTRPVRKDPPRASLSSLPGLQELKGTLLASPALKQAVLDEAHPTTPPNHTPEMNFHHETAPQQQGGDSCDSVRSDAAIFGDSQHASNDTVKVTLGQPHDSPLEIPHVQIIPAQNTSIHDQYPPMNQIEKPEVTKLAVPGYTPFSIPLHPQGTPIRSPGIFASLLTPSPQFKSPGSPQKSPVSPTNLLIFPSPIVVVPNLATPSPTTPTTPTSPIMSPAPIKHQSWTPAAFGQTPAHQTPALPPRSPYRPPPPGLNRTPAAGGEEKDSGVIGDQSSAGLDEAARDQPQLRTVGEPEGKPESEEKTPSVWVERTPNCDTRERENQDATIRRPGEIQRKGIYVGEMKYFVGRYLGGGGMGKVYSVVSKESMNLNALKVIRRKYLISGDFATVRDEWSVLKAISEAKFFHARRPNGLQFVQNLLESWFDKENIYFVMPLCVYSLWSHLETVKFDPLTIRVYAAELISGLEVLHRMRIIHCDIKPENILVSPDGHLSISDFGLAVSWLDPRYENHPAHAFRGRSLAGTDGYMAPEIVSTIWDPNGHRRGNFGFAADIWSLGVVIAELGMRGRRFVSEEDEEERERWGGNFRHFSRIMTLSHEMLLKRVDKCLRGDHAILVERMIEINETTRATFDEITAHPFFSELDFEKVLYREYQVPIPPFEGVLPCRHTTVDKDWFSKHSLSGQGSVPEDDLEYDEMRATCLTPDADRWVMPDDFVWELGKAVRGARQARQAAART